MKAWGIAFKDLTQSFRSLFAVVFMFGIPILVTAMFYFMLGSGGDDQEGMSLAPTAVQLVNLDQGSPSFMKGMSEQTGSMPEGMNYTEADNMGEVLIAILHSPDFAELISLTVVADEAAARAAVDEQQAGVAVIIPENFTAALIESNSRAVVGIYQDPALTVGPTIVRAILAQMIEIFSGAKIGLGVVFEQLNQADVTVDDAALDSITRQYIQEAMGGQTSLLTLDVRTPAGESVGNQSINYMAIILSSMMVFFGFFTGASTAESILREDERGTLSRLFTTPTRAGTILSGKLIAVALTLVVQVIFLMLFGWLVFRIDWGDLLPAFLSGLGLVTIAGTFGVFVVSWLKNTRQSSVVFGGVLTITGMLGVIHMFTMGAPNANPLADKISLLVPQGWAMRLLRIAMDGTPLVELLPWFGGVLVWSVAFFIIGNLRLQRRFA
jgi:ABC-type Na+ efflux pump permease subunit